jgi:hypothetical protein
VDDVGEVVQARVEREHVDDAAVVAFYRHVDPDHQPGPDGARIEIGDGRPAGRERLLGRFEVSPHRQRRFGRQQGVHHLLSVLPQQHDIRAGQLLRNDRDRLGPEGREIVGAQPRREGEHLQDGDVGMQLLLDDRRHAADQLLRPLAGGRHSILVLRVLTAEIEQQERHDAGDH